VLGQAEADQQDGRRCVDDPEPTWGDRDRREHVGDAVCRARLERLGVAAERRDEARRCGSVEQPVGHSVSQQLPSADQMRQRLGQLMNDGFHPVGADSEEAAADRPHDAHGPRLTAGQRDHDQGRRGDERPSRSCARIHMTIRAATTQARGRTT
jgi:hypothetical protein